MNRLYLVSILSAAMLAACSDSDNAGSGQGTLSLSVTDAVIDSADNVVIEFESVSIKPADGEAFDRAVEVCNDDDPPLCDPVQIDLLALTGGVAAEILPGEVLDAGEYNWIRLNVNETNSYIVIGAGDPDSGQHPLTIPSNAQSGLKLNRGFTVPNGGEASFTIDFDLRKSIVKVADGDYKLKPVLRMVDDTQVGEIAGTVDATLLSTECVNTSVYAGAVYVFDSTALSADDIDGADPEPITSALVADDGSYMVAFLEPGDYQVSYTCQADLDTADVDDSLVMTFSPLLPVSVVADVTTPRDI